MTCVKPDAIGLASALMILLTACGAKAPETGAALVPAVAAAPVDVSKGPATATVSADGEVIAIKVPERTIELSVADVFGMQKTKFDKAIIVAQGHQGDRYDVLLRAEAPSDPKQDGGRCAKGREISMRHIAFDTGSTTTSSSSDFESCLDRLRVVAERREPDGRLEYDLKQGHEDGSESDVYLHYETVDFKKSINF